MPEITVIASTNFRNRQQRFGIKQDDRRRHMYIIGKTGMGKSQLIENMAIQDIQSNKGIAVVDPHGDMIERILRFIPASRINDIVYFNPADLNYPIAFNVLEKVSIEQRHLVASGLIGVFKKIWADSWGPRLEYVLHNAISALLEYPGSTLLSIMRMLTDKDFRKRVISKINDPVVKAFWVEEYSKYPDKFQAEAIAPIQNKVGRFLTSSLVRNIVGQVTSTINVRDIMDQQKIFLINLSKGRVGEDNSALLGALLITKMQLAAMSRVDVPEETRKDFYLYVDEFQNFATESFAGILSEARKYRLNIILAHQYIAQLVHDSNSTVRDAVFGNVGTLITFRVGAADAEFMEPEFTPAMTQEDLVNLPKFQIYIKLMIDGVTSNAFSATTLPPVPSPTDSEQIIEKVIKVSRERYAKPREVIEDKIIRWSESKDDEEGSATSSGASHESGPYREAPRREMSRPMPRSQGYQGPTQRTNVAIPGSGGAPRQSQPTSRQQPPRQPRREENRPADFPAECTVCGKKIRVKFKPDPTRPVYCSECLAQIQAGKITIIPNAPQETSIPREISLTEALGRGNHPAKPTIELQPGEAQKISADSQTNSVIKPGETIQL